MDERMKQIAWKAWDHARETCELGIEHSLYRACEAVLASRTPSVASGRGDAQRIYIGDLRRRLFAEFDCPWNGLVRDLTAAYAAGDLKDGPMMHNLLRMKELNVGA